MGIRGELFSTKLILQNRTYFFNVKENRMGDLYLNIVESKNKETGGFERQSVIVFADDLPGFLGNFDEALKILEKAVREQKRGPKKASGRDGKPSQDAKTAAAATVSDTKPTRGSKVSGTKKLVVRKSRTET
jgi:hypothetical protein